MPQKLDEFIQLNSKDTINSLISPIPESVIDSILENGLSKNVATQIQDVENKLNTIENVIQYSLFTHGFIGLIIVFVLVFAIICIYFFTRSLKKRLKESHLNQAQIHFTIQIVRMVLFLMTIIILAFFLNFSPSSIFTLLGSIIFLIGFSLQGALINFSNGVLLVLLKYFDVGDLIEVQGERGMVEKIELFNTVLISPKGQYIIWPNAKLSSDKIINLSMEYALIFFTIKIHKLENLKTARQNLEDIFTEFTENIEILTDPAPIIRFKKEKQKFRVNCWTSLENLSDTRAKLLTKLQNKFNIENYTIRMS